MLIKRGSDLIMFLKIIFYYLTDEYLANAEYVDLTANPERYTGYKAPHAHKIWNSIYQENCFAE